MGAGASAGLYPLWSELISLLADEAVERGSATPEDRKDWIRAANERPYQVASGIKQALGDANYGAIMHDTFKRKSSPSGNPFTPIHEALARLPFRGYITTNYDPGLLEACAEVRRRGGVPSHCTWQDKDVLARWLTGEIFATEDSPILFAHGIYNRSKTIVLGVGEYREVYRDEFCRQVFQRFLATDRLVFVGFGFTDDWFGFLADEVLGRAAEPVAGEPRHFALVGIGAEEEYAADKRRPFQDQYNAQVYFYRVPMTPNGKEDHSELLEVLDTLVRKLSQRDPGIDREPPGRPPAIQDVPELTAES